jgi:hypothetical protein
MVSLFGSDIPQENISGRVEKQGVRLEFKLPLDFDPAVPKSQVFVIKPGEKFKGMTALGANRFWYYHDLPDKNFATISKLVAKNCI